ncbi:MAG: DASH family cryptochrome [Saprospiraceae bacterium]|nr:DASH family cryptochrome [Bacteroidia bacterium]NNE15535.1 DASH family cryptochrome [Saprospiraceae bacterium]NNL93042.1 DASH family cryptochrome [Saprospiraceae bacterium]
MKKSIIWFRNDLRLHDNEALVDALGHNDEIIPIFIFDERIFLGKSRFGSRKTSYQRCQFIIDSVKDLREKFKNLSSNLYVRIGKPEEIIPEIASQLKTSYVYCNRERTQEELDVQDELEKNLWLIGQEMRYYRGKMLYYTADLPFPISHCPDIFSNFRKEVEKYVPIREPFDPPTEKIPHSVSEVEYGDIPSLKDFGFDVDYIPVYRGGETEALKSLNYYLWETDLIATYKETRNQLLGRDFSSKFSAYLSAGCLSPKKIFNEVKKYENERVKNKSTYWLIFELLWRDFFRFMAKKHGNAIFKKNGLKGGKELKSYDKSELLEKWKNGNTGIPFIDANMRELKATGFMSNRGRQNVASFLIKDLKINWQLGADHFESLLLDYDPCSNYGNWNYLAGIGNDPRENRYFNIATQAQRYDPEAKYIRHWIPELAEAPLELIFNPYLDEDKKLVLEHNYIQPCIHIKTWN